jgi:hypothetical protein
VALQTDQTAVAYLDISSTAFDYNSAYTICGWVNDETVYGNHGYVVLGHGWQDCDEIYRATTIKLLASISASYVQESPTALQIPGDSWHHVAMVRVDASSLHAYVDGVLAATVVKDITGRTSGAGHLEMGRLSRNNSQINTVGFAGWKAWTRALTAAEIIRESKTVLPNSVESLWAVWPFIDDALDIGGKGNDFSEPGGPLTVIAGPEIAYAPQQPIIVEDEATTTTTGSTISLDSVDSQYVSLTEGVDDSNDYTVCWWMTTPTGLGKYVGVGTFESGKINYWDRLTFQKGNSDSQWRAAISSRTQHPTATTYTGFVIGAGPWFVTYKREGDDVTCRVYHGATYTEGTVTRSPTGRSSGTETSLGAYTTHTTATTTAEFAHFKAWSRALTDSELAREKEFSRAQIRDSIVGEWAMRGGSVLRDLDYSGRGNALVETGSPTDGFTSFGVAVAPQPLIIVEEASAPAPVTVTLLTSPVNLY